MKSTPWVPKLSSARQARRDDLKRANPPPHNQISYFTPHVVLGELKATKGDTWEFRQVMTKNWSTP